ncbi:MAG: hypothetical protein EAY75_12275 [Bacteroidetes bacterium]|nr:MAG: hypothetical protein EAY75_12275 [Bacteroidota bacterium]
MKKLVRILARLAAILLLLLLTLWVLVQLPPVQSWLASAAAKRLSTKLGTTVTIKSARIVLFNTISLQGLYVADKQKNTLLSAGEMRVHASDWFFKHDSAALHYVRLKNVEVNLQRTDSIWNYQFLTDFFGGSKKEAGTNATALSLRVVDIENLMLRKMDDWRGRGLVVGVGSLHMEANQLNFSNSKINIERLILDAPEYREFKKTGLWLPADSVRYYQAQRAAYLADSLRPKADQTNPAFELLVKQITLKKGVVEVYNRPTKASEANVFDQRHIIINSISGTINNLRLNGADTITALVKISAKERSGLHLKKLHTNFTMTPQLMEFANLDLQLNQSKLGSYYAMRYSSLDKMDDFIDSVYISARLQNSTIHIPDLGYFAPLLFSKNQTAVLSGNATGTVANFAIKELNLKTGASRLTGNYAMAGLANIDKTIIDWQTTGSSISLPDVAVWAPQVSALYNSPTYNPGTIFYKGNFKGTVYDFAAVGHLATPAGSLDAKFSLKLDGPKKGYAATITNASINGNKLLGISKLGQINFNGTVSSNGFGAQNPILIDGRISKGLYNGYEYQNLLAKGNFTQNVLTANLILSDENLAGNFETQLNFSANRNRYKGNGILSRANLQALGFSKDALGFSGEFDVDFSGKNLDEFLGYARFHSAKVMLGKTRLNFDSLTLQSSINENNEKTINLNTNEATAELKGKFNIASLGTSFQYFLNRYYPSVIPAPKQTAKNQDFSFSIATKHIEPFLALIDSNLHGLNYAKISGRLNTTTSTLAIDTDVPAVGYRNVLVSNAVLCGTGSLEKLNILGNIDNIQINDSLSFPHAAVDINTNFDTTRVLLSTSTNGPLGNARLNAMAINNPNGFDVLFNESSFIVNKKKWSIKEASGLSLNNNYLTSPGITLVQDSQQLRLYTQPSETGNWNDIFITMKAINASDILPYFLSEPRLEGLVDGEAKIENPLSSPIISSKLNVSEFRFNNDSVGLVSLQGTYNVATKTLDALLDSKNPNYEFGGSVMLNLNSEAEFQINTNIPLKRTRINILSRYLTSVFDEVDGFASGNLQLVGKLTAPRLLGRVKLTDAKLKVNYTKCEYDIDSATLNFGYNFVDLGTFAIKDQQKRTGTVDGIFYHRFFDSLSFNIKVRSQSLQVLNTESKDNSLFYGQAVTSASLDLVGPINNLNMRIAGKPTDSSHIFINTQGGRENAEADFIVFKTYGTEMASTTSAESTNITADIDLTANNLCKIDVILDELTGDVIKAYGSGNLKIHTGSTDITVIRGRYNVEKVIYDYRFQTLIRKPFLLLPDGNNFIEWNGDPYDANLNINAVYSAKNVSLSSLIGNNSNNTLLDANAQSYTGNVDVVAALKGRLSKPNLDFSIEIPPGSSMANNLSVQEMMRRIKDDATEKLRQVTYLIVFKSFAPYKEGGSSRNPGTDLAVNTITDLLSDGLGKLLSDAVRKITGNYSLNVDVSTNFYSSSQLVGGNVVASSSYDRVKLDLNLSQAFFKNKLVLNAGTDVDASVRSSPITGVQLLPDFSAEIILTANRRLRFIVFKRDNLDFSGRRNRAGASISYRKDYEIVFGKRDDALFMNNSRKTPKSADSTKAQPPTTLKSE